ncbi:MAG: flagellar export chaperone FliS [Lachnospiraceae bacterium]|nr:flagellar export chaperone FliS [Lachnospiraceae bacterium]
MTPSHGYDVYQRNKILTATPADLTLMLYEGAIKFCNIAIVACEKKDIQKAHDNIRKTDRVIEEFQITLNRKYKVAEDFDEVYKYIRQRLTEANVSKDPEILEEVLKHLRTMRDTWKEVMRLTNNGTKVN